MQSVSQVKALVKADGPLKFGIDSGDFYTGGSWSGSETGVAHSVVIVGYQDNVNVPGGGYLIIKDSYGTSGGWPTLGTGYEAVPYAGLAWDQGVEPVAGGAYFNGWLNDINWNGGSGNWNGTATNWTRAYDDDQALHEASSIYVWLNGESKANFGGASGGTVTVGAVYYEYLRHYGEHRRIRIQR